nr:reverse transcriptase domain-containing protein [Tanacetum cinerariifolium]
MPDTGLFCEPSAVGSRAKLYPNGKASPGVSLRIQKITQILPGASHRGHHRPAHQANFLIEKLDDAPPDTSVIKTLQEPCTLFMGRRSFLKPRLRCVGPLQADYVIREIHEGSCTLGTFYKWGINIVGPFSEGPGKVKFLIVAMDYFTKWIEAKAVATSTDNQSNGLVERANWSLGEGIKARLDKGNKNLIEELLHVLWDHRTRIKSSHDDTPFSLTYVTKAVIPAEIKMPTYHNVVVDAVHNNEELWLNLDLLEEWRECVAIRKAKAKLKMTKYYNTRVRSVTFRPGDFVYRSNEAGHAMDGGKLGPKWEGPYEVTEALRDEAYRLRFMDGDVLPRTWNIANLKKCYL